MPRVGRVWGSVSTPSNEARTEIDGCNIHIRPLQTEKLRAPSPDASDATDLIGNKSRTEIILYPDCLISTLRFAPFGPEPHAHVDVVVDITSRLGVVETGNRPAYWAAPFLCDGDIDAGRPSSSISLVLISAIFLTDGRPINPIPFPAAKQRLYSYVTCFKKRRRNQARIPCRDAPFP